MTQEVPAPIPLQASKAADGTLSVPAAHEIRNALQSMMGLLYLLEKEATLTPQGTLYLDAVRTELSRGAEIARQTLSSYRAKPSEMLDLAALVDSVLALYKSRIAAKHIAINRRYRFAGTILLRASKMRELFANLFLNAIDALPEKNGGTITIRISKGCEWGAQLRNGVRVLIADSGSGIKPRNLSRIFEPFYTTKGTEGSGMGLSIVQEIVQEHGGSLRVRSSVRTGSRGTVFSIFLPFRIVETRP